MKRFLLVSLICVMWSNFGLGEESSIEDIKKIDIENQEIKINDSSKLVFKAKLVKLERFEVSLTQLAEFDGILWYSDSNPPRMLLRKGYFFVDGIKVSLDVSSLANPWVSGDKINPKFVRVLKLGKDVSEGLSVTVCFAKGGANDYLVEWLVKGGKSIRMKVDNLGDAYPDWVSDRK